MVRYYVNMFYDKSMSDCLSKQMIGLFGEHKWDGRGNFCGWYGAEFYLNTELYAHYFTEGGILYAPEKRVSEVVIHNPAVKYDEVMIGSCYWERYIDAETPEEAIDKFRDGDWER